MVRALCLRFVALLAISGFCSGVAAQIFPTKPVRIVIPVRQAAPADRARRERCAARCGRPARMLYILMDARFEPDLAAALAPHR
jgi:hypothetical protein